MVATNSLTIFFLFKIRGRSKELNVIFGNYMGDARFIVRTILT